MPDPVGPDPATRDLLAEAQARPGVAMHLAVHGQTPNVSDHIAFHAYVSTYCLHTRHRDCRLTCKVCRASCLCTCHTTPDAPPPLPDEPPDGAICPGTEGDLWQRRDDWAMNSSRWFRGGHGITYPLALEAGLNPGRRLVELPGDAVDVIAEAIADCDMPTRPPVVWRAKAERAVRALAERGQQ